MWSWMLYGASEGAVEIPEIKTQIIQVYYKAGFTLTLVRLAKI